MSGIAETVRKARTKLFKSNKTQAVRFPKAVAFNDDVTEVEIIVVGESRLVFPAGSNRIDLFFDGPALVTHDFMADRQQPPIQERAGL